MYRTPEEIKAEIFSDIKGDWDTREGSFADDMIGPVVLEMSKTEESLRAQRYMIWVDETSGPYLDLAAEDIGIEPRKAGTYADTVLEVKGDSGFVVKKGTAFVTEQALMFYVREDTALSKDGEAFVDVIAAETGAKYNVAENRILFQFVNSSQITSVTNPYKAVGGSDPESDTALYKRIVQARQKPSTSGNKYDYERWALEVPGVGAARVFPIWNGRGTVKVLIANEDKQPVSTKILEDCFDHIADEMPIGGIDLTVSTPEEMVINVSGSVNLQSGYEISAVTEELKKRLAEHFSDVSLREFPIVHNYICALIIGIDGVQNYTEVTMNGHRDDIMLSADEIPVVGEVVLHG